MPFAHVAQSLDPNDFVIFPHVAMLDEFQMTDDDGNVLANIDRNYIAKVVARMNEREATTGDLAPGVIGHTRDKEAQGDEEVNGPPLVAYCRNWVQDAFYDTGKTAAFADVWVFKGDVERLKKYPRRSCEVWVNKYEIDPVSFLGATTPARDLGMMHLKLSRDGAATVTVSAPVTGGLFDRPVRLQRPPTNRESTQMPEPRADKPAGEESSTGSNKEITGLLNQLLAAVGSLADSIKAGGAAGAAKPAGATAAGAEAPAGAEGEEGALSDDELEEMLSQYAGEEGASGAKAAPSEATEDESEGEEEPEPEEDEEDDEEETKSRKGSPVAKNSGQPGGNNTNSPSLVKKMSREQKNSDELKIVKAKLSRLEVQAAVNKAVNEQNADLDPNDETLITDLSALPPDLRANMLVRLSKKKAISGANRSGHAGAAHASSEEAGVKRPSPTDVPKIIKLARKKGVSYDEAAEELGFTAGK